MMFSEFYLFTIYKDLLKSATTNNNIQLLANKL